MQFLIFALVYPLIWFLSKLPFRVLYVISDLVFFILYYIVGYRKDVVRFNLKTAFPNMDEVTLKKTEKRFYHHFCDLFIEVIKTLSISEQTLRDRYLFTNIEVLQKYIDRGQPVLVHWIDPGSTWIDPGSTQDLPHPKSILDRLGRPTCRRQNKQLQLTASISVCKFQLQLQLAHCKCSLGFIGFYSRERDLQ